MERLATLNNMAKRASGPSAPAASRGDILADVAGLMAAGGCRTSELEEGPLKDAVRDIERHGVRRVASVHLKPPPRHIVADLLEEQHMVVRAALKSNVCVVGSAGTGKTFLIDAFKRWQGDALTACAMTATAASHFDGSTFHSAFGIRPGDTLENVQRRWGIREGGRIVDDTNPYVVAWRDRRVFIVDEVWMAEAKLFQMASELLTTALRCSEPFGGVRCVAFGDPRQLPAVDAERHLFDSSLFPEFFPRMVELTRVVRQKGDSEFRRVLAMVASDVGDELDRDEGLLDALRSRFVEPGSSAEPDVLTDTRVFVAGTNRTVNALNARAKEGTRPASEDDIFDARPRTTLVHTGPFPRELRERSVEECSGPSGERRSNVSEPILPGTPAHARFVQCTQGAAPVDSKKLFGCIRRNPSMSSLSPAELRPIQRALEAHIGAKPDLVTRFWKGQHVMLTCALSTGRTSAEDGKEASGASPARRAPALTKGARGVVVGVLDGDESVGVYDRFVSEEYGARMRKYQNAVGKSRAPDGSGDGNGDDGGDDGRDDASSTVRADAVSTGRKAVKRPREGGTGGAGGAGGAGGSQDGVSVKPPSMVDVRRSVVQRKLLDPVRHYGVSEDMQRGKSLVVDFQGVRAAVPLKLLKTDVIRMCPPREGLSRGVVPFEERERHRHYVCVTPLTDARAMTIYGIQGYTLSGGIVVYTDDIYSPATFYVALSRATRLADVTLVGDRNRLPYLLFPDSFPEAMRLRVSAVLFCKAVHAAALHVRDKHDGKPWHFPTAKVVQELRRLRRLTQSRVDGLIETAEEKRRRWDERRAEEDATAERRVSESRAGMGNTTENLGQAAPGGRLAVFASSKLFRGV